MNIIRDLVEQHENESSQEIVSICIGFQLFSHETTEKFGQIWGIHAVYYNGQGVIVNGDWVKNICVPHADLQKAIDEMRKQIADAIDEERES